MRLMSEDKFPGAVALLALLAVLASMLVMTAYLNETVSLQAHWRSRVAALSLSDRLRQTSDDLTRMVRLYAVNGDPLYREYFDEILAIRNGEAPRPVNYFSVPYWDIVLNSGERFGEPGSAVPIRAIAEGSGLLNEELALLNNAEDASNELAVIENEIMAVIASGPGVVDLANPPEGETLQAIQRLHSQEYHGAKAVIMSNLAELGRNVMATFGEVRQRLIELSTSSLSGNTILVGLTMVVVAADLWFQVRRRGLRQAFGSRATGFSLLASLLACLLVLLSLTLFTYFLREQPGVSRAI